MSLAERESCLFLFLPVTIFLPFIILIRFHFIFSLLLSLIFLPSHLEIFLSHFTVYVFLVQKLLFFRVLADFFPCLSCPALCTVSLVLLRFYITDYSCDTSQRVIGIVLLRYLLISCECLRKGSCPLVSDYFSVL